MSDGDNGPASHQTVQGVPESFLRLAVERRGCLIEQKNGRILEERTGNADALPLAGRQLHAPVEKDEDVPGEDDLLRESPRISWSALGSS